MVLVGSLPGQNVTTPEEPFLLVGGNPKFASGTSLVSPVDPPAMYCENVAFRSDGGLVPIPGEVVEKEETRAKTDLMEGYLASLSPLLIMGGIAIAVLAVPMPTFMKGFLFGCILMGTAGIRIWFTVLYPKKNPCVRSFKSGTSAIIPGQYPWERSHFIELNCSIKLETGCCRFDFCWCRDTLGRSVENAFLKTGAEGLAEYTVASAEEIGMRAGFVGW